MTDRPRTRPYARIERERRFLLDAWPDFVDPDVYERLRDLYITGTELRLRRIEDPSGALIQVKLGQKRPNPADPGNARHREMTTFYLRPDDELVLAALPGKRLVKRRYKVAEQGWTFCIDAFEEPGESRGLLIAEVECPTDAELDAIDPPAWVTREVTDDPSFSGWVLAR